MQMGTTYPLDRNQGKEIGVGQLLLKDENLEKEMRPPYCLSWGKTLIKMVKYSRIEVREKNIPSSVR